MQEISEAIQAMKFGGVTIYPLLFLAVLALVIIIDKLYLYRRYIRLPKSLLGLIETYNFSWEKLGQELASLPPENYYARFFRIVQGNLDKPVWWLESRAETRRN